jgi:NAD(P)-dependent dehydrogenase (short-subunit alcohol dehydrogenase family)
MSGLDGKVALVTGATGAMGEAIAHRLARDGATVVGVGRGADRGAQAVERIRAEGLRADFLAADISREDEVAAVVEAAARQYGSVDIVVNNAASLDASTRESAAHLEPTPTFDAILKVGLYAPFWLAKYAAPVMIAGGRGGLFVAISSYASARGVAGIPAYTAAKGGLEALTRQLAAEYAEHGIRANTLVLGSISVPRNADLHADDAMAQALRGARMTDRPGDPADVAAAVAFLASDEASFITGATLNVDGGLLAKAPVLRVAQRATRNLDPAPVQAGDPAPAAAGRE